MFVVCVCAREPVCLRARAPRPALSRVKGAARRACCAAARRRRRRWPIASANAMGPMRAASRHSLYGQQTSLIGAAPARHNAGKRSLSRNPSVRLQAGAWAPDKRTHTQALVSVQHARTHTRAKWPSATLRERHTHSRKCLSSLTFSRLLAGSAAYARAHYRASHLSEPPSRLKRAQIDPWPSSSLRARARCLDHVSHTALDMRRAARLYVRSQEALMAPISARRLFAGPFDLEQRR